ncbi:hypothetical protein FTO70_03405 [Methanosarcina sp. KYL-1]|uniref:hypothetical protein n=1 Tax=Methanosarcina sp. KYL-1 TaxID=2602068 RepID=UPI002101A29D|nr:hypothetical protein [Methanosarcina sp. KYL-1]MCQ1534753.1 hypothetical protein [Methanosarcina sp. KYL-1]
MENLTKLLTAVLLIVAAGIIGAIVVFNPPDGPGEGGARQTASIWGESTLDAFVSESEDYEDHFVFRYIPRNPNATIDCYMSYAFEEDGNTLESADNKYYDGVSAENPIVFEFPRKKGSTYKLEVTIKDNSGITLHKSGLEIYPQTEGHEIEQ